METLEVVKKLEAATAHIESLEMKIKMYEDVLIPELRAAAEKAELERARLAGRLYRVSEAVNRIHTMSAFKMIERKISPMDDRFLAAEAEILVRRQMLPKILEFVDVDVREDKIYAQLSLVKPERRLWNG